MTLPLKQYPAASVPRIFLWALAALAVSLLASCLAPARAPQKVPLEHETEIPYESMAAAIAVGNPQAALDQYESALRTRPQARETRVLHARLLILAGKLEEAREELDLLLAEDGRDAGVLYNLSVVEGLKGNRRKQKELLILAVDADPRNAEALAALGDVALEEKDTARAGDLFTRALAVDAASLVALLGQGAILSREKQFDKAEAAYSRAIESEPSYPFSYIDRARARRARGDVDGAIQDLSQAIRLDPSYAWNYLDRGKLYLQAGKTPQALEDFSMALQLDGSLFEAYAVRAELLYRTGKDAPALADYEKLTTLRPDYYFAYLPLGALYMRKADWSRAERAFRESFRYETEEYNRALLAALAMRRGGRPKEAADFLRDVAPRIPRESWEFEVARFIMDPATDFSLTARIDGEKNKGIRARMLYYIASVYLVAGKQRAALSYLLEVEKTGAPGAVETRLAAGELAKLTDMSR